jgi:histidyl-tRNA synthetase
MLDARQVEYQVSPGLVRGLDYYTRTAWEFVTDRLGAQGTIGGGGRYDGLSEQLGGPPAPGVGFGSGIERVLELAGDDAGAQSGWVCFAVVSADARPRLYAIMDELRLRGRTADAVYGGRSLRRQLEQAGRRGAAVSVIVGDDEWGRGVAVVRDMNTGDQREVALDDLLGDLS